MFPTYTLEWFFGDRWHEIGWRADTPRSYADLQRHAEAMAKPGGRYRLIRLSLLGEPKTVMREWA